MAKPSLQSSSGEVPAATDKQSTTIKAEIPKSPVAALTKSNTLDRLEAAVVGDRVTSLAPNVTVENISTPPKERQGSPADTARSPRFQRKLGQMQAGKRLEAMATFVEKLLVQLDGAGNRINDRRLRKSATSHVCDKLRQAQSSKLQQIHRDLTRLRRVGFFLKQKLDALTNSKTELPEHAHALRGIEDKLVMGERSMMHLQAALIDLNRKLLGGLLLASSHKRRRGRAFGIWKAALLELKSQVKQRKRTARDAILAAFSRESASLFSNRKLSASDFRVADTQPVDSHASQLDAPPGNISDRELKSYAETAACWQPFGTALLPTLSAAMLRGHENRHGAPAQAWQTLAWKMVFLASHPSDVLQSTNLRWMQTLLRERREVSDGEDGFGSHQPTLLENSHRCLSYRLAQTPDAVTAADADGVVVGGPDICLDFVLLKGSQPVAWKDWLPNNCSGGTPKFPLAGAHSLTVLLEPDSLTSPVIREGNTTLFPVEVWMETCQKAVRQLRRTLDAWWAYINAERRLGSLGCDNLVTEMRAKCAVAIDFIVDRPQLTLSTTQRQKVRSTRTACLYLTRYHLVHRRFVVQGFTRLPKSQLVQWLSPLGAHPLVSNFEVHSIPMKSVKGRDLLLRAFTKRAECIQPG